MSKDEEEITRYFVRFSPRVWDECTESEFRSAEHGLDLIGPQVDLVEAMAFEVL